MKDSPPLASNVFLTALGLGLVGDLLLRATPWGLNVFAWILLLGFSLIYLAHRHGVELTSEGRWLIGVAEALAGFFVWRASPALLALDMLAVFGTLTLATLASDGYRVRSSGVFQYLVAGFLAAFDVARSFPQLAIRRSQQPWGAGGVGRHTRAGAVGLLIAVPLVLTFGGLLVAADAVFENLVMRTLDVDVSRLFSHALLIGVLAWGACGLLVRTLSPRHPAAESLLRPPHGMLGALEVGVPLGLLNALFLTFVIVQLRFLFGDHSLVESTMGLTYSEYARRGFFELVVVAGLVLPLLLLADYVVAESDESARLTVRALSVLQVALLCVIMASAVQRMLLYVDAYGLTESRLYATAFMGGLALLLIWFCVTVLRGRREAFAAGALAVGLQVLVVLNVLNPDALIVRVNASRAAGGEAFDVSYVAFLSADAVPTLLSSLDALTPGARCKAADALLTRWGSGDDVDLRSWNAARTRARRGVERHRVELESLVCPIVPSGAEAEAPRVAVARQVDRSRRSDPPQGVTAIH